MSTDFRALCAERPSVDELGLIYHDCCRGCEFMDQGGFEDAALAVLARWGQPPAPPAEGEVADGPAVPEGRGPAAVAGQPSDQEGPSAENVEELCEEHCFNVEGYESIECLQGLINEAIARWGNRQGSLESSSSAKGEVHAAPVPADGPAALPIDFIDPEHSGTNREMLEEFYAAAFCEGGTDDVITLRGINAVLARWGQPPAPPAEGEVAELAALIRQIALAWEPDACLLGNMTAGQLTRAAELLERHAAPVPVPLPAPQGGEVEL